MHQIFFGSLQLQWFSICQVVNCTVSKTHTQIRFSSFAMDYLLTWFSYLRKVIFPNSILSEILTWKVEFLIFDLFEKNTTKKLFLTSVENNYCCSLPEFDLLIEFSLYHNLGKKKIHNRVCGFEKKIRKLLFNIILNVFLPVFSNFSLVDFLKTYLCLAVKSTILLLMLLYVTITIKLLLQFLQKLHYYYYLRGKIQVNQYFNSKNLSLSKGCTYM